MRPRSGVPRRPPPPRLSYGGRPREVLPPPVDALPLAFCEHGDLALRAADAVQRRDARGVQRDAWDRLAGLELHKSKAARPAASTCIDPGRSSMRGEACACVDGESVVGDRFHGDGVRAASCRVEAIDLRGDQIWALPASDNFQRDAATRALACAWRIFLPFLAAANQASARTHAHTHATAGISSWHLRRRLSVENDSR